MDQFGQNIFIIFFVFITNDYANQRTVSLKNNEAFLKTSLEHVHLYILDISKILHQTSELFVSFSIDSTDIRKGLHQPSLRNSTVVRLMSYLSPGYLRVGGTEADRLIFKEENAVPLSTLPLNPNDTFFMSDREWMDICTFAKNINFTVIFDLNVLLRRNYQWDTTNAKNLLDFSARNGLDVIWQLGNEPNSFLHRFNVTLSPSQLARDFASLRLLLNSYPVYRKALLVGPDVTSPHPHISTGYQALPADTFLQKFVASGGSKAVDVLTWHHYYLHSNTSTDDFLDAPVFNSLQTVIDSVKQAIKNSGKPLWITESGSASGGGVAGVTDRFIASFLFLDRLGLAAREGMDVVVRQSLYSGHYALFNKKTLVPNPDWWVSYIYKRLVTKTVLSIQPAHVVPDTLRLYAQCSHNSTVVVFGMNLSNLTEHLMISTDSSASTAQFYQLTAPLLSRKVMLNGVPLILPRDSPPLLPSVTVDVQHQLAVKRHSIFFLHLCNLHSYLCIDT